jgi:hypothetical protein
MAKVCPGTLLLVFLQLDLMANSQLNAVSQTIHNAARDGNIEVVQSLIKANPDLVRSTDADGKTPLHWAAEYCHPDVAIFLLDNAAEIDAKSNSGTPLSFAARKGCVAVVKLLTDRGAALDTALLNEGRTPLHSAVIFGQVEAVKMLLSRGSSVSAKDKYGATPLNYALVLGDPQIPDLIRNQSPGEIKRASIEPIPSRAASKLFPEFVVSAFESPSVTNKVQTPTTSPNVSAKADVSTSGATPIQPQTMLDERAAAMTASPAILKLSDECNRKYSGRACEPLERVARDESANVDDRCAAIQIFGRRPAWVKPMRIVPPAIREEEWNLVVRLSSEAKDPEVRSCAIRRLWVFQKDDGPLLEKIAQDDPSPIVRRTAVSMFNIIQQDPSGKGLFFLIDVAKTDSEEAVRVEAMVRFQLLENQEQMAYDRRMKDERQKGLQPLPPMWAPGPNSSGACIAALGPTPPGEGTYHVWIGTRMVTCNVSKVGR